MPSDELITESLPFLEAVAKLRSLEPFYRSLAHHAADFWDDATFMEKLLRADLPVEPPPKPTFRIVQ